MQLLGWIAISLVVAFALRRRPAVLVNIGLALWVLIPGVAASIVIGKAAGSFSFHPSAWLMLCALPIVMLDDLRDASREIGRHFILYLVLAITALAAILVTRAGTDPGSLVIVVDEMIAPLFLFVLANIAMNRDARATVSMRNALLGLATLEACLSLVQYVAGGTIWYSAAYATNYWFNPDTWTRWMGTTDHPLNLAFLLCAAAPLTAGLTRLRIQLPILGLLVLGVLVSQSRTGVVAMAVAVFYVLLRSQMRPLGKAVLGVTMTTLISIALFSSFSEGLIARISNDTGSAGARGAALDYFLANAQDFAFTGGGITSSYLVSREAGLATSLESSILMYAVGLGAFFTLLYFGAQVYLVGRYAVHRRPAVDPLRGLLLSAVIVLVVPQTYSALAADTLSGTLLWFVLAMTCVPVVAGTGPKVAHQQETRADDPAGVPSGVVA